MSNPNPFSNGRQRKGRLAEGTKEPDRMRRCEAIVYREDEEPDSQPCDAPFAFYLHDGTRMCANHDRAWRMVSEGQ